MPRISKEQLRDVPEIILNWGCGHAKSGKWINIDTNHSVGPDFTDSIVRFPWDWDSNSIDRIILNHILEHVSKAFHAPIFLEANRTLKMGGEFYIAYPDFVKCAQAYIEGNTKTREFWEWTIYGRQTYAGDFHVCAITADYLEGKLLDCGFEKINIVEDPRTPQYTNGLFRKFREVQSYEQAQASKWRY